MLCNGYVYGTYNIGDCIKKQAHVIFIGALFFKKHHAQTELSQWSTILNSEGYYHRKLNKKKFNVKHFMRAVTIANAFCCSAAKQKRKCWQFTVHSFFLHHRGEKYAV